MAACLAGAAAVIRDGGHPVEAARLLGAAAAVRETRPSRVFAHEFALIDQDTAATRAALGEEAFAAAWAEGRAMSLEQAIADTLTEFSPNTAAPLSNGL
jgi:hypothetical protein